MTHLPALLSRSQDTCSLVGKCLEDEGVFLDASNSAAATTAQNEGRDFLRRLVFLMKNVFGNTSIIRGLLLANVVSPSWRVFEAWNTNFRYKISCPVYQCLVMSRSNVVVLFRLGASFSFLQLTPSAMAIIWLCRHVMELKPRARGGLEKGSNTSPKHSTKLCKTIAMRTWSDADKQTSEDINVTDLDSYRKWLSLMRNKIVFAFRCFREFFS